jgi:transcriptional regulator of nitric oxide reductase
MLTSQFANIVTFFYPLGNTPAVSLAQGLPLERQADILLLGNGDIRHVLFTVHTDREFRSSYDQAATYAHMITDRPLDITCCDVEKAIIGASIFGPKLLTDLRKSSQHPSALTHH